jgi:methylenetetrahydrofolate dehydrogenase (NADP+)/methenyltetrahydrofolate cyclohydrolase
VTARILDGKATAAQIRSEVAERIRALAERGVTPGLAAVLVGEDQASRIYVGQKHKACADVGIRSEQIDLPVYVTEHELLATIRRLNRDPEIHGIIVQLPLPDHLRELDIQMAVSAEKDVDGLHPLNIGLMLRRGPGYLPATP